MVAAYFSYKGCIQAEYGRSNVKLLLLFFQDFFKVLIILFLLSISLFIVF